MQLRESATWFGYTDLMVRSTYRYAEVIGGGFTHDAFHPIAIKPDGLQVAFTSTDDGYYQAMLSIIHQARDEALAKPRVDMPGAEITPGEVHVGLP